MRSESCRPTTGLVLGKFMPPHLGHKYLIDFARGCVDLLTVVVDAPRHEPIPRDLRVGWLKEMFPGVRVEALTRHTPQEPSEHPDFWEIWRQTLRGALPLGPDYVFASEDYGWKLAEILGARFIPVDISRDLVPVSATAVRRQPLKNWRFIPECVRPYFARRISIFGPESTGKSTLARNLAQFYKTACVGEFARSWLEPKGGLCLPGDMPIIARGQAASEDALARQANRVLLCDTDPLATVVWSEALFGSCEPQVRALAENRRYDLCLLTDVDTPWVRDSVRYFPAGRRAFFERCRETLENAGRSYVVISGSWRDRMRQACRAVDAVLQDHAELDSGSSLLAERSHV